MPALPTLLASVALASPFDGDLPRCDDAFPPRDTAPESDDLDVFLLTMSPGAEPFSFVGHSAVWVRRPGRFDTVYNFGSFNSEAQEPASALMFGTLECYWTRRTRQRELERYAAQDRSMIAQRIELPHTERYRFATEIQKRAKGRESPERFHWFRNNCATGIRDTLDLALGGWLREQLAQPAAMTPRQEALRHFEPHEAVRFAWTQQAGWWADQTITRYEDAFIPERLAEALTDVRWTWEDGQERPLASAPCELLRASYGAPRPEPPRRALAYWVVGTALAALGLARGRVLGALAVGFGLLAGLLGTANVVFAIWSNVEGYGPNENWFVTSPLSFLLVGPGWRLARGRPVGRWRLAALGSGALALAGLLLQPVLPQVNLDVMGLFAPLPVALAWRLRR